VLAFKEALSTFDGLDNVVVDGINDHSRANLNFCHHFLSNASVMTSVPVPKGFQALPLAVAQLSLAAVLKCGQSFRWSTFPIPSHKSPDPEVAQETELPAVEYRLCLRDRVVCLRQSPDTLFYRSYFPDPQPAPPEALSREAETLVWLKDYFQLDVDLEELYTQWSSKDAVFAKFQERFKGIRMLRQDPWENLISYVSSCPNAWSSSFIYVPSFICSSNNNISRITKMVQNLCKHFSPPLLSLPDHCNPGEVCTYHPFPSPSALAEPTVNATLRSLGFGYRADYIQRTSKMLVDTHGLSPLSPEMREPSEVWLDTLRQVDTAAAREELLKFVGVGRKVADCVLLMSMDKVLFYQLLQ
jgi:N-glycosylase/DNA lyase